MPELSISGIEAAGNLITVGGDMATAISEHTATAFLGSLLNRSESASSGLHANFIIGALSYNQAAAFLLE